MYNRARYYDPASGIFIGRDPLEYVDGMSLYRGYFVPTVVDPSGMDIYLEQGLKDKLRSPHQAICVDTWSSDCQRKLKKRCFSFGAVLGRGIWTDLNENLSSETRCGSTWLGHPNDYHYCQFVGEIYEAVPVVGADLRRQKSTSCKQDQKWLTYMLKWKGIRGGYSLARNNCRQFSQLEFKIAPGTELPYYRDVCCRYSNGIEEWALTLKATIGESAKGRCQRRKNGPWGGWFHHWTVVSSVEGSCD